MNNFEIKFVNFAMQDYLIVIAGFLILIGIKIFLTMRTYKVKKNLYENPETLARDIYGKRDPKIKEFLTNMYDINQLNPLVERSCLIIQDNCTLSISFS